MENPLGHYAEAVRAEEGGNDDRAAMELARAFGAGKVTKPIADNVKLLTDPPVILGEGLLRLMENGTKQKR
jgi:hypothetical protein